MQSEKSFSARTPPQQTFDVLHVATGCWACGGGLSEVAARLAFAQQRAGKRVAVIYLNRHAPHPVLADLEAAGGSVFPFPQTLPGSFGFSLPLLRQLPGLIRRTRTLIVHGCWTFPVLLASHCARRAGIPVFLFPHGSLHPAALTRSARKKRLLFSLFNRRALERATALCVCSEQEAADCRAQLAPGCPPLRLIPNGVDGAAMDAVPPPPQEKTLLYLGRLHPLKGIDLLLEAWRRLAPPPPWHLILAGPSDGYRPADLPPGVSCAGLLTGEAKIRALKAAHALILPSRGENFGIVIAEALRCRTPALCTTAVPWELPPPFRVDPEVSALQQALQTLIGTPRRELDRVFTPLYDKVRRELEWDSIAAQLDAALSSGNASPIIRNS